MSRRAVARAHGSFNLASGLWALLHLRSFEAVTGPKTDDWLVRTVAALVAANGLVQLGASGSPESRVHARRLGLGTAVALAGIDLGYVPRGVIGPVYLLDAAAQLGWVAAWLKARE